jgi:uncharacterized protein YbbK (DUF523 family)
LSEAKEKVFISACLLGEKVRYDGGDCNSGHPFITWLKEEGLLVALCPEISGGLPVPREPCEIDESGNVISKTGVKYTNEFNLGAAKALSLLQSNNIKYAILKARSPSCGSLNIYDGTFSETTRAGQGKTALLLRENGIEVFNEDNLDKLAAYFKFSLS